MAKKKARVRLVDTTFRDAQQSLLGGNLRSEEIIPIAAKMDAIGFSAMEAFGGATFETQLRRREDPWDYLRKLRKATPNTPIQALIRGQNLVSKRNFADDVVELFVKHAAKCGVDVFRVFDPLNDLRNMESAIGAALKAKKQVQGALSYAVSPAHNLELWGSLAKGLVNMGCHEIVIKDTSGLLSPQATWELVTALKRAVKIPIDVHSHCSSGMAPMDYMAAIEAGVDADILRYQMPGLMIEDIYRQLEAHEASGRIGDVLKEAARVRLELGYPPLVAPIRQMIATQAVNNVIGGGSCATGPQELRDYQ